MLTYDIQYINGGQGRVTCEELCTKGPVFMFINDEGLTTLIVPMEHVTYIKLNED